MKLVLPVIINNLLFLLLNYILKINIGSGSTINDCLSCSGSNYPFFDP
jgi:hypothetical protein